MADQGARLGWLAGTLRTPLSRVRERVVSRVALRAHGLEAATTQLVAAALAIAAIMWVVLVAPRPVWSGQPSGPPAPGQSTASDMGWPGVALAAAFVMGLCLPFRPYVLALRALDQVGSSLRLVLGLTAGLALVALLIYPAFGSDLFVYVDYERLWTVYGENPLLAAPDLHPTDWAYQYVWLPHQPSPYGPLWALLTWPLSRLADASASLQVVGYKLLALAGYVVCGWLVWSSVQPARRTRAMVMFAWSPLVLFETLAKAHNDVLLAVAALAGVRLAASGAGVPAAVAGALIKLSGLAVLPAVVVDQVRHRRWRAVAVGAVAGAGLVVLTYAPFWRGPDTLLPVFVQTSRVVWSPGSLLVVAGLAPTVVRVALLGACLVVGYVMLRRERDVATAAGLLQLASLLLLTTAFFAHYLVPVVALAAVSRRAWLQGLVLALSVGAMAAYGVELVGIALPPGWLGSPGYQVSGSVVLLAPAAVWGALFVMDRCRVSASPRPRG